MDYINPDAAFNEVAARRGLNEVSFSSDRQLNARILSPVAPNTFKPMPPMTSFGPCKLASSREDLDVKCHTIQRLPSSRDRDLTFFQSPTIPKVGSCLYLNEHIIPSSAITYSDQTRPTFLKPILKATNSNTSVHTENSVSISISNKSDII